MIESLKVKVPRAIKLVAVRTCHCFKCGHDWPTRLKAPKRPARCPGCSNRLWFKPYKYKTYRGKDHNLVGEGVVVEEKAE